jgi:hypothetical protein
MAQQTLLNQFEIIKYTGIRQDTALCAFNLIFQIEYKEFRKCLGIAFYEELKADLITHVYTTFKSGTNYAIGQKVTFQGVIYEAINATTQAPSYAADWKEVKKFNKECFNELWCNFLATYLAWRVLREHQPYLESLIGEEKGKAQYDREIVAIDNSANNTLNNLVFWVKSKNTEGCFDKMKFIANTCCGGCGCEVAECSCDCTDSIGYHHKYAMY